MRSFIVLAYCYNERTSNDVCNVTLVGLRTVTIKYIQSFTSMYYLIKYITIVYVNVHVYGILLVIEQYPSNVKS